MVEIKGKNDPVISVIMPVYNSQDLLHLAVESVINQTFQNWELLLINDGSKDKSGELCESYAKQDKRIRFFHQENKGITKTRNRGILESRGEYITFIDNDDEYLPDILEKAYERARKYHADIVKFGYRVEEDFKTGLKEIRDNCAKEEIVLEKGNLGSNYKEVKASGYFNMIWNGIYKRRLFENKEFLFDESVIMGYEDWIFNNNIYLYPERQVVMNYVGYIHYQRYQHSTSKKFHPNQVVASIKAAETEQNLTQRINELYGMNLRWNIRAADYLIDIIFLFERKGCIYRYREKKKVLQMIREQNVFSVLHDESNVKNLPRQRRMLIGLLKKQHYFLLLFLSKVYYKFILLKKMKNKKGE